MQANTVSRTVCCAGGDRESETSEDQQQAQAGATHETKRVGGGLSHVNATPAFSPEKWPSAELVVHGLIVPRDLYFGLS